MSLQSIASVSGAAPAALAEVQASGACYVYAVVSASAPIPRGLTGVGQAPVRRVLVDDLQVVVSPAPRRRVRPRRRELKAHQDILNTVLDVTRDDSSSGALPFAFGTVVPAVSELRRLLGEEADAVRGQLKHVAGCVELGLRLSWDVADVPAWFVSRSAELSALRDAAFAGGTPSHEELIAIGQRFDQLRTEARDAAWAKVKGPLGAVAREVKRNPEKTEATVLDISLLVPRAALVDWDGALEAVASGFDDDHLFSVTGPWAPFSFVSLDVEG